MILVAGATGFLGRAIAHRLLAAGRPVRALVRATSDVEVVGRLRGLGAEVAMGDLKDRASLRSACAGATAVVSTVSATRSRAEGDGIDAADRRGQLNLVEAARAAGARHFVLVSVTRRIDSEDPLTRAKREVEAAVRQSGMTFTLLRPGLFMESWLSPALGFDYVAGRATIYGPGTRPISWISLDDVAEYAVQSLDDPAAEDATLELGGPEALTPLEAVRIFEEVAGRKFEVSHVPEEALREQAAAATDPLQQTFAALMLAYAAGCEIPPNRELEADVALHTVRDYAGQAMARAVSPPAVG